MAKSGSSGHLGSITGEGGGSLSGQLSHMVTNMSGEAITCDQHFTKLEGMTAKIEKRLGRGFPGGPAVKTPCCLMQVTRVQSLVRYLDLKCHYICLHATTKDSARHNY